MCSIELWMHLGTTNAEQRFFRSLPVTSPMASSRQWKSFVHSQIKAATYNNATKASKELAYGFLLIDLHDITSLSFVYIAAHLWNVKRRSSHAPNLMQMSKILCSSSFALGSAHEKSDVWTRPYTHSIPYNDCKLVETLKIKMLSFFGVTVVLFLIKILRGQWLPNLTADKTIGYIKT